MVEMTVKQLKWLGLLLVLMSTLTACELVPLPPSTHAENSAPLRNTLFTSEKGGYSVILDGEWRLYRPTQDRSAGLLAGLQAMATTTENSLAVEEFLASGGADGIELIAVGPNAGLGQEGAALFLTITSIERDGLTLKQYLDALQAHLPADAEIAESMLGYRHSLAVLNGWIKFSRSTINGSSPVTYGQHIQLNATNSQFILLSFSAPSQQFSDYQSTIAQILDSLAYH